MSTSNTKRKLLIKEMDRLGGLGINCQNCQGTCCTSVANSMLITPKEAKDILSFLKSRERLTGDLKKKLKECVKEYRLDYEIITTRGLPLRRTYTCPFFEPGPKGCTIDREFKPYGCLAFNPSEKNSTGNSCYSRKDLLEYTQEEPPQKIPWDKKSIPMALLDLWPDL